MKTQSAEIFIDGLTVHTDQESLPNSSVWISNHKIKAISAPFSKFTQKQDRQVLHFPSNYHLIPGRIDLHIHGAGGADFMDATPEALNKICTALVSEGTTSFLATTVTESATKIENALKNLYQYQQQESSKLGVEILGVHLEGPFISPKQIGAHQAKMILLPNLSLFDSWQTCSGNQIRLVTLAPEQPGAISLINHLIQRGVIAAIGHTDADFSTTELAINAGAHHATHLFNAMRGFHHRDPGCLGALLLDSRVTAELIVDGYHLHPAALHLALQTKGLSKIILVTDGMRAKCCAEEGEFELGGQSVIVKNGAARLSNGTLAGSILTMSKAVKNLLQLTQCSLQDSIILTSVNPAKALNIFDHKGSIAVGKDADLVVLNEEHDVVLTICRGNILYPALG